MELRKKREKDFHNRSFSEETRSEVGKFYAVTRSSKAFYKDLLKSHCSGAEVLEIGCGPGNYASFLDELNATVTGIDISETALQQAKEKAKQDQLKRATFRSMDAEALEFGNSAFDLICGSGILHHLDLGRSFAQLARVLKPNGTAIFTEPLGHNPLINLYRKATPNLRTEDEHPLLMKDLRLAGNFFGKIEAYYFHLNSLLAVPFRNLTTFSKLLETLDAADRALFRFFPLAKRFAWQVIIKMSQPDKIYTTGRDPN